MYLNQMKLKFISYPDSVNIAQASADCIVYEVAECKRLLVQVNWIKTYSDLAD